MSAAGPHDLGDDLFGEGGGLLMQVGGFDEGVEDQLADVAAETFLGAADDAVRFVDEGVEEDFHLFLEGVSFGGGEAEAVDLLTNGVDDEVAPAADGEDAETDVVDPAVVPFDRFLLFGKRMNLSAGEGGHEEECDDEGYEDDLFARHDYRVSFHK